jgi:transcriptional regulator with XRE-family HTH domain
MITGLQIRSARNALRMSVEQLSEASGVSVRTIKRMEAEDGIPNSTRPNVSAIETTLIAAGVEFIGTPEDRPGIRIAIPRHGK